MNEQLPLFIPKEVVKCGWDNCGKLVYVSEKYTDEHGRIFTRCSECHGWFQFDGSRKRDKENPEKIIDKVT